jgi:hypothetical protein
MKTGTDVSEIALRSFKLEEDEFRSKLHHPDRAISSCKKKLEANGILHTNNKIQIQLQTVTDGLR